MAVPAAASHDALRLGECADTRDTAKNSCLKMSVIARRDRPIQ
jgi:hypothetical protein